MLKYYINRLKDIFQDKYIVAVIGLTVIFIIINVLWLLQENQGAFWDDAWYLENSMDLYNSLTRHGIRALIISYINAFHIKAPLIAVLPLPYYLLFGPSTKAALMVPLTFILIFNLYFYFLVKLILNKKTALLAVIITYTFPIVASMSRQFMVDYILMAFVTIWLYYLLKSNLFKIKKYNYVLGLMLGLGLLLKVTFAVFVCGPLAIAIFYRLKENNYKIKRQLVSDFGEVLLIGGLIAATWYLPNLPNIIRFTFANSFGRVAKDYAMSDTFVGSLKPWLLTHINYGLSVFYFAILVLLFLLFVIRYYFQKKEQLLKLDRLHFLIVLAWFIVPFIVFTLSVNKTIRFMLPAYPVIAIIISFLYFNVVRGKTVQMITGPLMLIMAVGLIVIQSFSLKYIPKLTYQKNDLILLNIGNFEVIDYLRLPVNQYWPQPELINLIMDNRHFSDSPSNVFLAFELKNFNFNNFLYYKALRNLPLNFTSAVHGSTEIDLMNTYNEKIKNSDFVVIKSDKPGPEFLNKINSMVKNSLTDSDQPRLEIMGNTISLKKLGEFSLPDQTKAIVYKTIKEEKIN
jgi:4-amino-4-deoxy-L-arabinose transferase-like glycosyltransferase